MTVNGELHKLAHNSSFGHGIREGIHWRSDTDYSTLLGEEVALSFFKRQSPNLQRRSLDNDHKNERTNVRSYQKFIAAAQRKPGTPAIGLLVAGFAVFGEGRTARGARLQRKSMSMM